MSRYNSMGCCKSKEPRKAPAPQSKAPLKRTPAKLSDPPHKAELSFHEDIPKPAIAVPNAMQPVLIPENTERLKHFYDVQQPPSRVKLYDIAKEVQILSLEKASPRDWQLTLSRSLNLTSAAGALHSASAATSNLTIHSQWDQRLLVETAGRILALPPRDWVQEQLVLYREQFRPGSDMATTARRKTLQLEEHFKWFAWALAAYYMVSVSGNDSEREFATLFLQPSEASFASHPNSSTASNVLQTGLSFDLPNSSEAWLQGFSFKGVYLRLALEFSKEAEVITAEGVALERLGQAFQVAQEGLAHALLFPMMSLVTFGPYLLHASPIIPGNFVGKSAVPTLEIPCPPRPPLVLPKENLLQLFKPASDSVSSRSGTSSAPISLKPLYMVVNVHTLLQPAKQPRFLLFLSSLGSEVRVMKLLDKDPAVPSRAAAMVKSEGKHLDITRLRTRTVERFGWVFEVHSDLVDTSQRPNRVAALLIPGSAGDFLVTARVKVSPGKHLSSQKQGKEGRRQSIKRVLSTLETTDTITNHAALAELMRRQRLGRRHAWLVLAKLKDYRGRLLMQTDLLARAVKKYVHCQYADKGLRSFGEYREVMAAALTDVIAEKPPKEEVMLCLFLSRLRALRDASKPPSSPSAAPALEPTTPHYQVLLEHEFLREVYKAASKNPGLFLSVRPT